jgi:hypothetical protein
MASGSPEATTYLSYSLIPALISNLEGVCRELAAGLGLIPPRNSSKFRKPEDEEDWIYFWAIFWELPGASLSHITWLEMFENSLFADAYLNEKERDGAVERTLNRHRIQHGNSKSYGQPVHLTRLFLSLDFVSQYEVNEQNAEYLQRFQPELIRRREMGFAQTAGKGR